MVSAVLPALLAAGLGAQPAPAQSDRLIGSGTGFVVDAAGWLVTNAHVVEGCARVEVDRLGPATRVIEDADNDLAALRIAPRGPLSALAIRPTPSRLAEPAHALGYPLSGVLAQSIKVTSGGISALAGLRNDSRFVQLTTPLQPGNSGGPVIDDAGRVIAVAAARLDPERFPEAQNVNFAIKSTILMEFLNAHGIGFALAAADPAPRPLPDTVEAAVPAVHAIHCFGPAAPTPDPAAAASRPEPTSGLRLAQGYDVVGFDYRTLRNMTLSGCERACLGERRCQAITFNRRHGVCFLKEDGAILLANDDAVGGYRPQLSDRLLRSSFRVLANMDAPQGDYARLRGTSFLNCYAECELDPRCRGFAYLRDRRECWLKDRIGPLRPQRGVELGLR